MELDQFYTKESIAKECFKFLLEHLEHLSLSPKKAFFLEPSAGTGSFYKLIQTKNKLGLDIEPKHPEIMKQDFLAWSGMIPVQRTKTVIIGNPPFGRRAKLAIDFFNRSARFGDTIAFILPVQFRKYSVHSKLDKGYRLIAEKLLPADAFFTENGKTFKANCVFQIWTALETGFTDLRIKSAPPIRHPDFEIYQYNNTPEALKVFGYEFDFAVPRQGYENYRVRISDRKKLVPQKQWALFKARSSEVKERLLQLDFERLAAKNTVIPGFGKADVIEEYLKRYGDRTMHV